jgi:hypothetical protein
MALILRHLHEMKIVENSCERHLTYRVFLRQVCRRRLKKCHGRITITSRGRVCERLKERYGDCHR